MTILNYFCTIRIHRRGEGCYDVYYVLYIEYIRLPVILSQFPVTLLSQKKFSRSVGILFFLVFYFAPKRHSVGIFFIFFINFHVHILSYQFQMLPSQCFHFFTFVNFHVRICTLLNPNLPTLTIKFHYERVHKGFITFITAL